MVKGRCVIILDHEAHETPLLIITEHPGTSRADRAVPNALTVLLICHVDARCSRRSRVTQAGVASSASDRDRQVLFHTLLLTPFLGTHGHTVEPPQRARGAHVRHAAPEQFRLVWTEAPDA